MPESTPSAGADELTARVRRALTERAFRIVYQPIVDLLDGRTVVVEALCRFTIEPHRSPDAWFSDAWQAGLGADLELAALEAALSRLDRIPMPCRIALNVSPSVLIHEELLRRVTTAGATRVVIELTEHTAVDDYDDVRAAADLLRDRGARLAVDDIGAGFASIRHIVKLVPEVIKLDRELVGGIDADPVRKSFAEALVGFATSVGSDIVAEGLETADELAMVRALGIRYGQGFLIAPPAGVESLGSSCTAVLGETNAARGSAGAATARALRHARTDLNETFALLARLLDAARRGVMSAQPAEVAALERAATALALIAERDGACRRLLVAQPHGS